MYGRLTTLNYLRERRDDPARAPFRRLQADRAIRQIITELRDKGLMRLRERLIKATIYGDQHQAWIIENQMAAYSKRFADIEAAEYTARDEDE